MEVDTLRQSFESSAKTNPDIYQVLKPKIDRMANKMKSVFAKSGDLLRSQPAYPVAFLYITANKLANTIPNVESDVEFDKMFTKAKGAVKPEDLPKLEAMADEIVNASGGRKMKGGDAVDVCRYIFGIGVLNIFRINRGVNMGGVYFAALTATLLALSAACLAYVNNLRENPADQMLAAPQPINVEEFIPKGNLTSPTIDLSRDETDPITLDEFENGQIVILLNGDIRNPVSREGLVQWFDQKTRNGHRFEWPATRVIVSNPSQLEARRVRITGQGGRKTKKVRKIRKSKTRKH
jgi:hypothetical protein